MEEEVLFKAMAKIDRELQELIESNPELEEIYLEMMGEAPGSVVYLERSPTAEDWARALELSKQR